MPLSNNRGEGFENKIADLLATSMGTTVQYYFRPSIERGMTRTTLYADECDLMMDMPLDSERVLTTEAIYRTTFVLAYREDKHWSFKNFDDPKLKKLKVGVYQTSAMREALWSMTSSTTSSSITSRTMRTSCRRMSRPTSCRK